MKTNRFIKKALATIVTMATVFTIGIGFTHNTALAYNAGIEAFVNSLYSDCLGRSADPTGFNDWCNKLATGQITGYNQRHRIMSEWREKDHDRKTVL